jgi:hypothetical protein
MGGAYRQVGETAPDEHLPAPAARDSDASGAGWVEHNTTQYRIARIVAAAGWAPRSPRAEEPRYDLAWARGQIIWVAEVKSVTSQNEERQLRTAIGQVLRYRQKLTASGHNVQAVIATSRPPSDPSCDELCQLEGIILAWPDVATSQRSATGFPAGKRLRRRPQVRHRTQDAHQLADLAYDAKRRKRCQPPFPVAPTGESPALP